MLTEQTAPTTKDELTVTVSCPCGAFWSHGSWNRRHSYACRHRDASDAARWLRDALARERSADAN